MNGQVLAVERHVRLRPVNADELLSRLAARSAAREVPPGPGALRTVRFGHVEVATASKASETFMRARWRERVGNSELGYLLVSDDSKTDGSVRVLACGNRYRLFDCDPSASTAEWLDLDAQLLSDERRAFLALLAPGYLAEGGFAELQAEARAFGSALGH